MKRLAIMLLAVVVLSICKTSCPAAMSDCHDATCRITCGDGVGTGCSFEISGGYVWVLTAAHLVRARTMQCEFWHRGHQSRALPAVLHARHAEADAAILRVDQRAFGGRLPMVIPIAAADTELRPGDPILSVGCARGAWATGFQGRIVGFDGPERIRFLPTPADGRSGSALFDGNGTQIIGVVSSRDVIQGGGEAVSLGALYRAFCRSTAARPPLVDVTFPRPGGGCTPWGCTPRTSPPTMPGGGCTPWGCTPRTSPPTVPDGGAWPTLPTRPTPVVPEEPEESEGAGVEGEEIAGLAEAVAAASRELEELGRRIALLERAGFIVHFAAGDEPGEEGVSTFVRAAGGEITIPAAALRVRAVGVDGREIGAPMLDLAPLGKPLKIKNRLE